jgi:uncharacterized protein DUF6152
MTRRILASFAVGMLAAATPVSAHHGSAASYDISKQVTLTGVVTDWVWKNPHCFILFDVTDEHGNVVNWGAETHPTNFLMRNEVKGVPVPLSASSFKPGDKVTVMVFPSRVGTPRGLLAKIVAADGTVLLDDGDTRLNRGGQ